MSISEKKRAFEQQGKLLYLTCSREPGWNFQSEQISINGKKKIRQLHGCEDIYILFIIYKC